MIENNNRDVEQPKGQDITVQEVVNEAPKTSRLVEDYPLFSSKSYDIAVFGMTINRLSKILITTIGLTSGALGYVYGRLNGLQQTRDALIAARDAQQIALSLAPSLEEYEERCFQNTFNQVGECIVQVDRLTYVNRQLVMDAVEQQEDLSNCIENMSLVLNQDSSVAHCLQECLDVQNTTIEAE